MIKKVTPASCVKDIHRLPKEISPRQEFEKNTEDKVAFSGRHSPFSNFHQANVQVNSRSFTWREQYFHFKKAVCANDHQAQVKILVENNPSRVKKLGDNICYVMLCYVTLYLYSAKIEEHRIY